MRFSLPSCVAGLLITQVVAAFACEGNGCLYIARLNLGTRLHPYKHLPKGFAYSLSVEKEHLEYMQLARTRPEGVAGICLCELSAGFDALPWLAAGAPVFVPSSAVSAGKDYTVAAADYLNATYPAQFHVSETFPPENGCFVIVGVSGKLAKSCE